MLHERWWTGTTVLALSLALSPPGAAQQSVLLRYHPTTGQRAHTLWWLETSATIRDAAQSGDSISLEIRGQQSITHRVVAIEGAVRTLHVVFDSARPRMRPAGGMWSAADLPIAGSSVTLRVDDRYRVLAVDTAFRDSVSGVAQRALRSFATGFEFAFPEGPVTVGEPWSADVVYFLLRPAGLDNEPVLTGRVEDSRELVARTTFVLDSLVDRGADSLAYLTVQGSFVPETVAAAPETGAGQTTTIRGAFAGALVWSTGWDAFVTGAMRTRTTLTMVERSTSEAGEPEVGPSGIILTLDTTGRFQVRR
jgi:hypothetical protein